MSEPKLSVLIPTYNAARYLAEAIESVLSQSFGDFELVVIDNASHDATSSLVAAFAARDPRVRFTVNETNIGMVNNWNRCLAEARGEYIKYLFADDLLCSTDSLARMLAALEADPKVALVASARRLIDEESRPFATVSYFVAGTAGCGEEVINHCLEFDRNLIGEPTAVLFRRRDAQRGFDGALHQLVDLEMWFHLLEKGGFAYLAEPLVAFRVHRDQETQRNRDRLEALTDQFLLADRYLGKDYVRLPWARRRYLAFNNCYRIWKLYERKVIDRATALTELRRRCRPALFWLGYPFFKLYKQLFTYQIKRLERKPLTLVPIAGRPM
jgi:glycosyltransferase involved in cell wall biosynthesis